MCVCVYSSKPHILSGSIRIILKIGGNSWRPKDSIRREGAEKERFPLVHTPERGDNHLANLSQVFISLCVCMHVFMYICICVHDPVFLLCVHTCDTGHLPWLLFILFLRQALSVTLKPTWLATLGRQQVLGSFCLASPGLGLQVCLTAPSFLMWVSGSKFSPQACTVRTLQTCPEHSSLKYLRKHVTVWQSIRMKFKGAIMQIPQATDYCTALRNEWCPDPPLLFPAPSLRVQTELVSKPILWEGNVEQHGRWLEEKEFQPGCHFSC